MRVNDAPRARSDPFFDSDIDALRRLLLLDDAMISPGLRGSGASADGVTGMRGDGVALVTPRPPPKVGAK